MRCARPRKAFNVGQIAASVGAVRTFDAVMPWTAMLMASKPPGGRMRLM